MPNRSRSLEKEQLRMARQHILDHSFRDREQAETICIVTSTQICCHLQTLFDGVPPSVYERFSRGEVIVDARGRGSFQQ
jgi:hypothetical protein